MSFEDPTKRLSVPPRQTTVAQTPAHETAAAAQTTTALPRPLNLADEQSADKTDELSLAEIFESPAEQPSATEPSGPSAADEAPTWTAMPVIPVRSEPISPASTDRETSQSDTKRTGPSAAERLRADAAAAWSGGLRRSQAWLSRDDNGLMLMTAVVAIILILVVAAVGS